LIWTSPHDPTQNGAKMTDPRRVVIIDYTNWEGVRGERRIIPVSLSFENSEWHPETQWILEAVDTESGVVLAFALAHIHSWRPAT
jgi:hypothetical protein